MSQAFQIGGAGTDQGILAGTTTPSQRSTLRLQPRTSSARSTEPSLSAPRTSLTYSELVFSVVAVHGPDFPHRYIPEETSFEDDVIHDEATEASVAAAGDRKSVV